jgi:hypothetical protein
VTHSLVSLLAIAAFPLTLGAQSFEGAITIRMAARGGAPPQEMEYLARNGNVRVTIAAPTGAISILGLAAESKTYVLMEAQRMYMEVPPPDSAAVAKVGEVKITKTGRIETIAGLSCEHIVVEAPGTASPQKADVCMTKGLGPFVNPMANVAGGRMTEWQKQLAQDGGFPLKVTLGDGTVPLEVTKIEKKRVSDTLFRIPADFTKMDMPRRP